MGNFEPPPPAHVRVHGRVVEGHGVASGRGGDPRYPEGTLALQWPHFEDLDDLPLDGLHRATVNVSTAPVRVEVVAPWWTIRRVTWHPDVAPEDFSFVPCRVTVGASRPVNGLVYHPDPDTKPEHHQPPEVLELLLPRLSSVHRDAVVRLDLPASQVTVHRPAPDPPGPSSHAD